MDDELSPAAEAKFIQFAHKQFEDEFSTPRLKKKLISKGLSEMQAQTIIKKMKKERRGGVRKSSVIKMASGLGLLLLTAVLVLATGRLFWYIAAIGAFSFGMGVVEMLTGVGERPDGT